MLIREYTHTIGTLENGDREFFERLNPGYKCTGETLIEEYKVFEDGETLVDGHSCTYVVMKGRFTQFEMCRDCGDHYIIARWSRYDRVDKQTRTITFDVEDE